MPAETRIEDLQDRFGIAETVRFEGGRGGLARAAVASPAASGDLYLHGAHVSHWQGAGQRPALFLSRRSWFEAGKPIRGGCAHLLSLVRVKIQGCE